MKIISLVSAVDQDIEKMLAGMHLETDAVVVNQCTSKPEEGTSEGYEKKEDSGSVFITMHQKGVGLSRNTCIENAPDCDVLLFTDEDIIYDKGYSSAIADEYGSHPEADAILFNVRVCEARRTYWNEDYARVRFHNYGRYPAYSISIKKGVLMKSGVRFPLDFGGGTKYINGEDSVFLHDLLKAGVKIYRSPVCLGEETERESTWFKGYNERFFVSRGALYVRLYGIWAYLRGVLFLVRHRYMYEECGYPQAIKWMRRGMKEVRDNKAN